MKLHVHVHRKKVNLTLQTGHQTPITDIVYYTDLKDFHFLLMQGTFHKLLHTIHIPTVIQIIFLTRLHLNLHFYNTKCHRVACLLLQLKKKPTIFLSQLILMYSHMENDFVQITVVTYSLQTSVLVSLW